MPSPNDGRYHARQISLDASHPPPCPADDADPHLAAHPPLPAREDRSDDTHSTTGGTVLGIGSRSLLAAVPSTASARGSKCPLRRWTLTPASLDPGSAYGG